MINPWRGTAGAGATDCATRVAAAEVADAAVLCAEMEREELEPARAGSRSPHRCRQSPSAEQRRGRHRCSPVLQASDFGAGMSWLMLTKSNYHEWSLLIKVKLQARRLWEAVSIAASSTMTITRPWRLFVPPSPLSSAFPSPTRPR